MCGGRPRSPKIVMQGPSQAEMEAQRQMMDQYRQQSEAQAAAMKRQLDEQITAANTEAERRRQELAAQQAAAAEEAARQMNGYAASASLSGAPEWALTTALLMPKKKPSPELRITPGATLAELGAGLNIGI